MLKKIKKQNTFIFNMLIVVEDYLVSNQAILLTIQGLAAMVLLLTGKVVKLK